IACAHSTSSEVSIDQPLRSCWWPLPVSFGLGPFSFRMLNVGIPGSQVTLDSPHMGGRPNSVSNTFRSSAIVELPNESTTAIVKPVPSKPWSYSGPRLYELRIASGAKHLLATGIAV